MKIASVSAREILDSRATPTVEATVTLENGVCASAAVPSGASTGRFEAIELRDNDMKYYHGKGVIKAVKNVNSVIAKAVVGRCVFDQQALDSLMCEADGTENKSNLGANAILAVSLAAAHAAAKTQGLPLYKYIGGAMADIMPLPMMNILNGGAHANNNIDIQEFMIMPKGAKSICEAVRMCSEVYWTLKSIIARMGGVTAIGDEGGFAPMLDSNEEAIQLLISAVEESGYKPGEDFVLAIDAASSEWFDGGVYKMPKSKRTYSTDELIDYWRTLTERYPIRSLEDGLAEDDWSGWTKLTAEIGNKCQLVGDDMFVTNCTRLSRGIKEKCANSILIKPNQIGTLTETVKAVRLAQQNGYTAVMSHRSGETKDTTIADLAVALGTGQIKTGAPSRGERTEKYNRLMWIEKELAPYTKMPIFKFF